MLSKILKHDSQGSDFRRHKITWRIQKWPERSKCDQKRQSSPFSHQWTKRPKTPILLLGPTIFWNWHPHTDRCLRDWVLRGLWLPSRNQSLQFCIGWNSIHGRWQRTQMLIIISQPSLPPNPLKLHHPRKSHRNLTSVLCTDSWARFPSILIPKQTPFLMHTTGKLAASSFLLSFPKITNQSRWDWKAL